MTLLSTLRGGEGEGGESDDDWERRMDEETDAVMKERVKTSTRELYLFESARRDPADLSFSEVDLIDVMLAAPTSWDAKKSSRKILASSSMVKWV
jgi:hypothetical protein